MNLDRIMRNTCYGKATENKASAFTAPFKRLVPDGPERRRLELFVFVLPAQFFSPAY
jgi:hypothetical protein